MIKLARQNEGTELEFEILTTVLRDRRSNDSATPPWRAEAMERLVRHHSDHPQLGMQVFQWIGNDLELNQLLLQTASRPEILANANLYVAQHYAETLRQWARLGTFTQREFQERLDKMLDHVQAILADPAEHRAPLRSQSVRSIAQQDLLRLRNEWAQHPWPVVQRAAQQVDRIISADARK